MFSILNGVFGWMPPLLGGLAVAACGIYVVITVIMVIKVVKDLIPFI